MVRLPGLGRIHSRWLVWSIRAGGLDVGPDDEPQGWEAIGPPTLSLFDDDPARRDRFAGFLERGHRGVVLPGIDRWRAYGWLATPTSGPAEHLPPATGGRWWIFYCRTADDERNRGHYRRALVRLVREAAATAGTDARVHIDTRDDNAPARSAIERLGFRPAGVVHLVRVPRTSLRTGTWRRGEAHG